MPRSRSAVAAASTSSAIGYDSSAGTPRVKLIWSRSVISSPRRRFVVCCRAASQEKSVWRPRVNRDLGRRARNGGQKRPRVSMRRAGAAPAEPQFAAGRPTARALQRDVLVRLRPVGAEAAEEQGVAPEADLGERREERGVRGRALTHAHASPAHARLCVFSAGSPADKRPQLVRAPRETSLMLSALVGGRGLV